MALQIAAQEPIIVDRGLFLIERRLGVTGETRVRVGEFVQPDAVVAVASAAPGRAITLHLAREIGVEPAALASHLTKPIGSSFQAGEAVARVRRGLRLATASAPDSGTLTEIDETNGTALFVPTAASAEVRAQVHGEVSAVDEGRGVVIQAVGARVQGAVGFGEDTFGPLAVAIDRADRELTADGVTPDLKGALVLAGMTVSAATLRRLAEVGARGVIVGSIGEAEVRRFVQAGEDGAEVTWRPGPFGTPLAPGLEKAPLAVFVTEGFGRRPMAAPIFQFLTQRDGQEASLLLPSVPSDDPRPALYFTAPIASGEDAVRPVAPANGIVARLCDPEHLGTVVTCRSEPVLRPALGAQRAVVEVELANGSRRWVPAANLEILRAAD